MNEIHHFIENLTYDPLKYKMDSLSPTLERKSRVVKSESGRRSRSRGKSNKKAVKRMNIPATSSSPVVDKSTFSIIFSETTMPIKLKFHIETPWDGEVIL